MSIQVDRSYNWNNATPEELENKTIDSDNNTITNIVDADIKSSAAIARSKLAAGTAHHVVLNDASGLMTSSVAPGSLGNLLQSNGTNWVSAGLLYLPTVTKTTTYTATTTDTVIFADATAAGWTLSLPTAVGITGKIYHIIKTDSSSNIVTIDPNGSETINGETTVPIGQQNRRFSLISDGTNWQITSSLREDSTIRLHTGNGAGSTNTTIRRYTTTVLNKGSDITYTDSATDGASFTINRAGVYSLSAWEPPAGSSNITIGFSLNSSQLSDPLPTIDAEDRLCLSTTSGTGNRPCVFWSGYLSAGDVVRPHISAIANFNDGSDVTGLTISRIGY